MRSPKVVLGLGTLVLCVFNLYVLISRSLIPAGVEGVVTGTEVRIEKLPGTDDVHIVEIDGRQIHVDSSIEGALSKGERVSKPAFSTSLETSDGPLSLRPSTEFWRMLIVMPSMLALTLWVLSLGRKGRRWSRVARAI
ncbi:MAG: hypothetical protein M3214_04125 [Actinomycetota bacterium]|nr:hypothetical protein [Actinomycetota bacterium]